MVDGTITIDMHVLEKKVAQKVNSKPRTILFQGKKDDTSTTTSIDDATQSEIVKELRHGKVAENNDVHQPYFIEEKMIVCVSCVDRE